MMRGRRILHVLAAGAVGAIAVVACVGDSPVAPTIIVVGADGSVESGAPDAVSPGEAGAVGEDTGTIPSRPCDLSRAFENPQLVEGVSTESAGELSHSLSPDEKEIYFLRSDATGFHVYRATRGGAGPFDRGSVVRGLDAGVSERDPFLAEDALYFVVENGGFDLYRAPRLGNAGFGPPVALTRLNSPANDSNPVLGNHGRTICFGSLRDHPKSNIYCADLDGGVPVQADGINLADESESNPVLSDDGLTLLFASEREGNARIYSATRASDTGPFGNVQALSALNQTTPGAIDRPGFLTKDGCALYFMSNRRGSGNDIWVARRPP